MDLRITLKFLKTTPSNECAVRLQPCTNNTFEITDKDYTVNNESETILCIITPRETAQTLSFDVLSPVRRVVLNGVDLPFEINDKTLTLPLPALTKNEDRAADMHMIMPFTGIEFRIEVAGLKRRAGNYATGDFPFNARTAAVVAQFALLDAVQSLGLDKEIGLGPCGPLYIMGFDTNNPCGHTDWPPHVHLHMARPAYGAPIGHYYFDSNLRFSHNLLYLRKVETDIQRFEHEQRCSHYAPDGSLLFDMSITQTGGLRLRSSNNETALIEPAGEGFDTGAIVTTNNISKHIHARISYDTGTVQAHRGDTAYIYHFDKDTGIFLGDSAAANANLLIPPNSNLPI